MFRDRATLDAHLDDVRQAPKGEGRVVMLVCRTAPGERDVRTEVTFDLHDGVVGDNWRARGNHRRPDGQANPEAQVTVMSSLAIDAIAGTVDSWPLAGDQVFVDLDLSQDALPAGSRLHLGTAVLEVSAEPHTGCARFVERYGLDAMKWVNSEVGRSLRLRGLNAKVVTPGTVAVGATVRTERR